MSIYIIGDVQGCFAELQNLLDIISFDSAKDQLAFVGDLVNRGPDSLRVLHFVKSVQAKVVLGNHDLYLLIVGYGAVAEDAYAHTLSAILAAEDKLELLDWLRHQPLILPLKSDAILVHAGIPPQWTISKAQAEAKKVEAILQGPHYFDFLKNIFGNEPKSWDEGNLTFGRSRYTINSLLRMRLCDAQGTLDLETTDPASLITSYKPWFEFRDFKQDQAEIFFGHWAALNGESTNPHCHALDTGCVWGHSLTAIRLEDKQRFSVLCKKN